MTKKTEIIVVIATLAMLIALWTINGYEDTWLYASAFLIAIPASWFYFNKKK